jgi:hypothetical protein
MWNKCYKQFYLSSATEIYCMNNFLKCFNKISLSVIVAAIVFFASCKKDKYTTADALVKDISGDCGFIIYVDFYAYQPRNLPDSMKVDSLPVVITYKLLERAPECFGTVPIEDMMHIQTIKRKL